MKLTRVVTLLLVLALALPCAAVGEETAADISGQWFLEELISDELAYRPIIEDEAMLSSFAALELSADGTGTIQSFFDMRPLSWRESGDGYEFVIGDTAHEATLTEGKLLVHGLNDTNEPGQALYCCVFSRQLSYSLVTPPSKASDEAQFWGKYEAVCLVNGGKAAKLDEVMHVSLSAGKVRIEADGINSICSTEFDGEALTVHPDAALSAILPAGYTHIRIRPCEGRALLAADIADENGALGYRLYLSGSERAQQAASTLEAEASALDVAFENDSLALVPCEWQAPSTLGMIPDGSFERIGEDTADARAKFEALSDLSGLIPVSFAPGGLSGIAMLGKNAFTFYGDTLNPLHPSPDKGADDEYGNLKYFFKARLTAMPLEGLVYSPDGRYALVPNAYEVERNSNLKIDPVLVDLSTGEALLIKSLANKMLDEKAGALVAGCFSPDGTLYYTLYRFGGIFELYRYEPDTRQDVLLLRTPGGMLNTVFGVGWYRAGLALSPEGEFAVMSVGTANKIPTQLVHIKSPDEIMFTLTPLELPVAGKYSYDKGSPVTSPITGYCVTKLTYNGSAMAMDMGGRPASDPPGVLLVAKLGSMPESTDKAWVIQDGTPKALALSEEELIAYIKGEDSEIEPNSLFTILALRLSPDGKYAVILARCKGEPRLVMLRLEDMSVKEVKGLDTGSIIYGAQARGFEQIIDWNSDILTIVTKNSLQPFRFE